MHQSFAVSVVQRLGYRRHEIGRLCAGWAGLPHSFGKIASLNELGDDEAQAICRATNVEDRDDVWMIEIGDGAGFPEVSFGVFGPRNQPAMRHLDGHEALQLIVMGQVNQSKAASTQDSLYPIATK